MRNQKHEGIVAGFSPTQMRQKRIALPAKPKTCTYCGTAGRPLTVDHIAPLTRGGEHATGNIAWCCRSCNCSKSNRFLLEWVLSGCAPVGRRREMLKQPKQRRGYMYPVWDVIEIRGDCEVLACGHLRPPRFNGKAASGLDTGLKARRACMECGKPKQWLLDEMRAR